MDKKYDIYNIDKDALFARITETIDSNTLSPEETDFSAFIDNIPETENSPETEYIPDNKNIPGKTSPRITFTKSFVSAAAAIVLLFAALPLLMSMDRNKIAESDNSAPAPAAEAQAEEEEYAENYDKGSDDSYYNDIEEDIPYGNDTYENTAEQSSELISFPASDGWEYTRVDISDARSFDDSEIEEIFPYESAHKGTIGTDLFSEEAVLGNTDFLLDCKVEEYSVSTYDNEMAFYYTVTPIHTVSGNDLTLPEKMTIRSGTAFVLRTGHEYLIPVKITEDGYEAADKCSPQTEITEDGLVIFHNGWKSLCNEKFCEYRNIDLSQITSSNYISEDDFFYDRLNVTAEISLQCLFDEYLYGQ